MSLHTTSEVISFVKQLEGKSANFYENLSQKHAADRDAFLSFAKENQKNVAQVERAYYSVITDAIESCFAFDINPDEYTFEVPPLDNTSYSQALNKAINIEERIVKFYSDAVEQSDALMGDIPVAFKMVARKRKDRISKLKSLLEVSQ